MCASACVYLRQDSGFQGYVPEHVHIMMHFKKLKNGTLSSVNLV